MAAEPILGADQDRVNHTERHPSAWRNPGCDKEGRDGYLTGNLAWRGKP